MSRPTAERVRLTTDAQGFVRRTCPQCRRQFKLSGAGAEELVLQATLHGLVPSANADEAPGLPQRFCPFCGHGASADAFLTAPQRAYIEGWAEHVRHGVRHEQLRQLERTLDANPYVTFVPVAPVQASPTIAPEPDDMLSISLWCCGEALKMPGSWADPYFCPHCRARHAGP